MIKALTVTKRLRADGHYCKSCNKSIKLGQSVIHLKLGSNMPYDGRHHYIHTSCMAAIVAQAPTFDSAEEALRGLREIELELR